MEYEKGKGKRLGEVKSRTNNGRKKNQKKGEEGQIGK
jgi:hypothetical protein